MSSIFKASRVTCVFRVSSHARFPSETRRAHCAQSEGCRGNETLFGATIPLILDIFWGVKSQKKGKGDSETATRSWAAPRAQEAQDRPLSRVCASGTDALSVRFPGRRGSVFTSHSLLLIKDEDGCTRMALGMYAGVSAAFRGKNIQRR